MDYLNCDNRNFLDIFNIEDETLKIILQVVILLESKDSEEKNRWLEANTNPISDDVFEELLVDKVSSWEECQFLLMRKFGAASTPIVEQSMAKWFSTEHTKNYDSRDILLRLYSGHACTVIRPGTNAHPLEDNDEMGLREMTRLQGHDAENLLLGKQGVSKENFRIY